MIERERLIELLDSGMLEVSDNYGMPNSTELADYLLNNGVIVPPYKVGDYLYGISLNGAIESTQIDEIVFNKRGVALWVKDKYEDCFSHSFYIDPKSIGKIVFLTREAAEKALKEREK